MKKRMKKQKEANALEGEEAKKNKKGKTTTLRRQMILAVTSICVATMVLTVAAGIISSTYAIKDNVRNDMSSMSQMAETAFSCKIQNIKANAESVARIYNAALINGEASAFIQVKNSLGNYGFSDGPVIRRPQVTKPT